MDQEIKIDINILKIVMGAVSKSNDLGIMANHLTQLIVGSLDIKGCTLFVLNSVTKELAPLATFGMSHNYINKGPVVFDKSIGCIKEKESIVIKDIANSDLLQYPEEAEKEGVRSIVSLPLLYAGDTIGALRLYHHSPWNITEEDLDSLLLVADIIGLAMMYTRMLNAMNVIKVSIDDLPLK